MKISYNNREYAMPDVLFAGAPKSGTTSLYHYLHASPELFFTQVKEPHFFSFFGNKPNFKSPERLPTVVADIEKYSAFFKQANEGQLLAEASQSYMFMNQELIANAKKLYGDEAKNIKVVLVLRNPIDRAWSQYWHFKKNYNEPLEFEEAISEEVLKQRKEDNWNVFYQYLDFGNYSDQIKALKAAFPKLKIYLYEELKNKPEEVLADICEFLGIAGVTANFDRKFNPSGKPKKDVFGRLWQLNTRLKFLKPIKKLLPYKFRKNLSNAVMERALERQKLPDEQRAVLREHYRNEITELANVLERKEVLEWLA